MASPSRIAPRNGSCPELLQERSMNRFARSGSLVGAIVLAFGGLALAADQESWDAIYVAGSKVGHTHVKVEQLKDKAGQDLLRVRVDWELSFERGNDRVRMSQAY